MHSPPTRIDAARTFALDAHGDQRYGEHPYHVHLDAVAELVEDHGEDAQVVAYLHDVVEDTDVDLATIDERFGTFVAQCVALLTDEPGDDRTERKRRTHAKMAAVTGDTELALVVKAADRLANLRACVADDKRDKLAMYKGEHAAFRKAVFREDHSVEPWYEMGRIVRLAQHGGFNYQFWSGDHGLIRQRSAPGAVYYPEVVAKGRWSQARWVKGTPGVMDAITGLGDDVWSSGGVWADEIPFEEAEERIRRLGLGPFDPMVDDSTAPPRRRIDTRYLGIALGIFLVEVAIAKWATGFVRHSVGDVLVVVLLYALFRGALGLGPRAAALTSVAAGVVAEALQAIRVADLLGLTPGSVAHIVLGNTASWLDLVMYGVGGVLAYTVDRHFGPAGS